MEFFNKTVENSLKTLNVSINGLSGERAEQNLKKYGKNALTKKKKKGFFSKLFGALKEPMLIILLFALVVAFGTKLGSFLKTGSADFSECLGIFLAVVLSVSITLIMEGSSERAFESLNNLYDNITVRVIREGQILVVNKQFVTVGDIILLESGDKIVADGRLIESNDLRVNESALTGESNSTKKNARAILSDSVPLAERENCVYSGTFVVSGSGKMLVTCVGDNTEIGKIAQELTDKTQQSSPLNIKLAKLGKTVSIIGAVCALVVFILSIVRLACSGTISYFSVQELFIECIILIVAAVPEGLPAIVAVSLALNMIKLAKENALIKKMIATETAGAVSVICSDKTGTLTQNKMSVVSFCSSEYCLKPAKISTDFILQNFICNTTADIIGYGKKAENVGSGTECALLSAVKNNVGVSYKDYRQSHPTLYRIPFSSKIKYMVTEIKSGDTYRTLVKGAPEVVLNMCALTPAQKNKINGDMAIHQNNASRVLCFAHKDSQNYSGKNGELTNFIYDGFAVLKDPVRPEIKEAVATCFKAGISVKMLTGDNLLTAYSIAKELKICSNQSECVLASYIESLDDEGLKRVLPRVKVIARSAPSTKLRVVKALQEMGEVTCVTGDGINDAPAVKRADLGVAMGITGSEITKEAADIILLDDSFLSVVKAVKFGRNVYKNLQRFIFFQLSVNLSALILVTVCACLGVGSPFNTLQLLWINIIMDGPPAITLGLEAVDDNIMKFPPIKKNASIVSAKIFFRILLGGVLVGGLVLAQYFFNFMNIPQQERQSVVFTLFIIFQLFNAFNARRLDSQSIFKNLKSNKVMVFTFTAVLMLHVFIVQIAYSLFGIAPMCLASWLKCLITASSIVVISEVYKFVYRKINKKTQRA